MPRSPEAPSSSAPHEIPPDSLEHTLDFNAPEIDQEGGEQRQDAEDVLSREHMLAEKLVNPELSGLNTLNDTINKAALKTVNTIEGVVHAGKDAYAFVKGKVLTARESRAQRKFDRLERKSQASMFAFRRKKFAKKAAAQRRVLDQRTAVRTKHHEQTQARHERLRDARTGRLDAYDARRNELMSIAQLAAWNKAQRHDRRLARAENRKRVDEETRRRLAEKRQTLFEAFQAVQ